MTTFMCLDVKLMCMFLERNAESGKMGYHLWDPEARKIVRSSDVIFNEKKMHK